MAYTLEIGEAIIEWESDIVKIGVEKVILASAPAFGEQTDHKNERWNSYTMWENSMDYINLKDLMFDKQHGGSADNFLWDGVYRRPLICDCPGSMPITEEHVLFAQSRLRIYKEYLYKKDRQHDYYLQNGEWLVWWLRWAVDNCRNPVFVNS